MLEGASTKIKKEMDIVHHYDDIGIAASSPEELALQMTKEMVNGLRSFINDEYNELEYALNIIGEHFLKPGTGRVILISRDRPAEKIAKEVSTASQIRLYLVRPSLI